MSRTFLKLLLVAAVGVAAAFVALVYWRSLPLPLPDGIAFGNGRIEARLADVAAKESLRVKEILVDEGDLVEPGQVVVRLDANTLEAELAGAKANVASTMEREAVISASIVRRKSEVELASIEWERTRKLVERGAVSREEYDQRTTHLEVTKAELAEEQAKLRTVQQDVKAAQASVATLQTRIDDATLQSPVRGRVLYRLTEVGEVLAPGGKALTLVNLEDVYMEIFLPSEQAAKVRIGGDARVTVDHAPGRAAAGYVSFVSPEAQFTPKQVETRSERDKLMFRVKIQVPEELVHSYIERIKTGVRGVGYVKLDESAVWPDWLQDLLAPLAKPEGVEPSPPEESAARDSPSPAAAQDLSPADTTSRPEGE